MRQQIAAALQVAGISILAAAGFSVSVALGLAVTGTGLVAFGLAVERG